MEYRAQVLRGLMTLTFNLLTSKQVFYAYNDDNEHSA